MVVRTADEVDAIAKRAAELALEREMANDINKASGIWLNVHAAKVDIRRNNEAESDYAFRERIKNEMRKQGLM